MLVKYPTWKLVKRVKFKVQTKVREDEQTERESGRWREKDYRESMTSHSEVPVIGPAVKVALTT